MCKYYVWQIIRWETLFFLSVWNSFYVCWASNLATHLIKRSYCNTQRDSCTAPYVMFALLPKGLGSSRFLWGILYSRSIQYLPNELSTGYLQYNQDSTSGTRLLVLVPIRLSHFTLIVLLTHSIQFGLEIHYRMCLFQDFLRPVKNEHIDIFRTSGYKFQ